MPSVFISYSHKDKALTKRIANDLIKKDIIVWLDEWEILVGDSITQRVQHGLENVDFIMLLLTKHSVQSGWVEKEWQSQIGLEAERQRIRILPVIGGACEIPALLKDKKYTDVEADYSKGVSELVNAIKSHMARPQQGQRVRRSHDHQALDAFSKRRSVIRRYGIPLILLTIVTSIAIALWRDDSPPATPTPVISTESEQAEREQAKKALSVFVEFWAETIDRASTQEEKATERAAFGKKFSNSSSLPPDIKELWLDAMLEQRKFLRESEFMKQFMKATGNPQHFCDGLVWLSRRSFEDLFPEDAERSEYCELPIYDSIEYADFQTSNRQVLSEEDKGALVHYAHEYVLSECMGLLLRKWKETESHHDRQPILSKAKEIARHTLPAKLAGSWVEHIFTEGEYVAPVWFARKVAEGGEGTELALIAITWLKDQALGSRTR